MPRRPLQKQKPSVRTCKQELWRRWLQQGRSYHWSNFAFSWRPPLTRWTLLSSHSRGALREQQHTRHHAAPQTVWSEKKFNKTHSLKGGGVTFDPGGPWIPCGPGSPWNRRHDVNHLQLKEVSEEFSEWICETGPGLRAAPGSSKTQLPVM